MRNVLQVLKDSISRKKDVKKRSFNSFEALFSSKFRINVENKRVGNLRGLF